MTVSLALQANQQAPGAPIAITATASQNDIADSLDHMCLGVKVASGAVTRYDQLAHVSGLTDGMTSTYWDSASEQFRQGYGASVNTAYVDSFSLTRLQRVDSDYAVGRFVWFLMFASATPGASDVPTKSAGPYTIR